MDMANMHRVTVFKKMTRLRAVKYLIVDSPRRFFATNELKTMLAHTVDIRHQIGRQHRAPA